MNRHRARVTFIVFILAAAGPGLAVDFAGGTGEPDDPYQIATAEQLLSIGSDPGLLASHFVMTDDIDLDPNLSEDYVFDRPIIGTFSGVFDGSDHRILHLTIGGSAGRNDGNVGLFERIEEGGQIRHLILEDVHISADSTARYVGAVCGSNNGVISKCAVAGIIAGEGMAGGVAGYNARFSMVKECTSNCAVSAGSSGGLIGVNKGEVQKCAAFGRISGWWAGGLVVDNFAGLISYSYAACQVESPSSVAGGLVAHDHTSGATITDSYFLCPSDGGGPDNELGTPLTSDQMKQPSSFTGWDFWGVGGVYSPHSWFMPEDAYPQLVWLALTSVPHVGGLAVDEAYRMVGETGIRVGQVVYDYDHEVEYGFVITTRPTLGALPGTAVDIVLSLGPYDWQQNPGSGDSESPFLILSAGQFDCLAFEPESWDRDFKLVGDLDMRWRVYHRPLIGRSLPGGMAFSGTFDGDGHLIKNLTIEGGSTVQDGPEMLGLFGEIGELGHVMDLGLTGVSIRGKAHRSEIAGMLCAINQGYIGRCYCLGELHGHERLGGLAGINAGVIEDCYAGGKVENMSHYNSGGLYAGLVAENVHGTIRTCYATSFVLSRNGAGLVASNESGVVENCLWDVETSWADTSDGGTGLTTQELMSLEVLRREGWGGSPNWIVDDGNDYPRLIWEGTPGRLIPGSLNGARR